MSDNTSYDEWKNSTGNSLIFIEKKRLNKMTRQT